MKCEMLAKSEMDEERWRGTRGMKLGKVGR
jgi:hypothetical protein